jgi:hypothetical protein
MIVTEIRLRLPNRTRGTNIKKQQGLRIYHFFDQQNHNAE